MSRGRLFSMHKCSIPGCRHTVPRRFFACTEHYAMVPKWLQLKLNEQMEYGRAWKCHPTQQYLELRSQAIDIVQRAAKEKYSPPEGAQLPLLPAS